ncbi:hypothetical protein TVAG_288030 [Trichomonas vaginalis G3]|uniref:CCR4-Not complex component Not1 C-terminal domain-containing protein n=1 Tax=Trichomonas vaginalis (strain ATCC PRA-98 / G3) TaxID=412133 RepID=A2G5D2_TRIV3|nr:nuclear-transcribed mRNA catabolic process, deadenylation-dependent decay [Trichomonas vaginalis G3]EAX87629.1 hypothetical protein TVAG_288030 [Trichomonas vaginalis G3]KAI5496955.1 nuclear-transcribed mRNA catabolic process, deadenylation-dependent decay [Trichomonas vaginalis G3]|eukprot:XP_001300559.1 hypothetical protein [Trichomonas vaginalis G3]
MRSGSNSSNSSIFLPQLSLGDIYLKLITICPEDSPHLPHIIQFITSDSYLNNFSSYQFASEMAKMLERYPERREITLRIFEKLVDFPVIHRIVNLVTKIDPLFFSDINENVQPKIANIFSFSHVENVAKLAQQYTFSQNKIIKFSHEGSFVSISDVFNEASAEVLDNYSSRSLQCIEQFQPFTENDISDFVINLVSNKSPISKNIANSDRNTQLGLLRPFKNSKITLEQLIKSFDSRSVIISTMNSFNVFISAIKEVTGSRSVPIAPFLGQWDHPKTQLNFLQHIINSSPMVVQIPKLQPTKINPILIGDFKGDHWRYPDFIVALATLYNELPGEINALLAQLSPSNSTALLLITLASLGETSSFAAQLLSNLISCNTQYMAGISALWAMNSKFLIDTCAKLHEDKPILLSRIFDIADDLCVLNEFKEKSPLKFRIVLEIFDFFRHGNDFRIFLKTQKTPEISLQIFERPTDFGFIIPMSIERHIKGDNKAFYSADLLFFTYLNDIFSNLDENIKLKAIPSLFQKCCERTKKLTQYEFKWHQKVSAPSSPRPPKDLDLTSLAMKTEKRENDKFRTIVASLVSDFPSDKVSAEKNGKNLGTLLARNLLSQSDQLSALNLITKGLTLRENSNGFIFAREAVREMAPGFKLCLPFARLIVVNPQIKRIMPDVHQQAINALKPSICELQEETAIQPTKFELHPKLKRFKYIRDNSLDDPDSLALTTINQKIYRITFDQNANDSNNCIEACLYKVYVILMNGDRYATWKLTRIAKYLSSKTLQNNNPSFARYFNLSDLVIFSYENNLLYMTLPFLSQLFDNVPNCFFPPCPWSVSILSALGAIYRLPFLKKTLSLTIKKIFDSFNCEIANIEPQRLRPLEHLPSKDSDFLFPPLNFEIPVISREKLYSGDIHSIVSVVSRFFKGADNQTTREVAAFVHSKVPAIAKSAYETSFNLTTKDFARSKDINALVTFALSLVRTLCKSLASVAVKLEFTYLDMKSTRFIENLVTVISQNVSSHLLRTNMEPLKALRETCDGPFLDVQAFPPSVVSIVPEDLWPHQSEAIENGRGIFGCYAVPSSMKTVYSHLDSIVMSNHTSGEIPFDPQFARTIYSCFTQSSSGEINGFNNRFQPLPHNPRLVIGTVITCFPPQMPTAGAQLGVQILNHLFVLIGGNMKELSPIVEEMIPEQMPHMLIFVTLISAISPNLVEYFLMNYFEENGAEGIDLEPLIKWLHEKLFTQRSIAPLEYGRLLAFLATAKIPTNEYLTEIINVYLSCAIDEGKVTRISPDPSNQEKMMLDEFSRIHTIRDHLYTFLNRNNEAFKGQGKWNSLIKTAYPNRRLELLQIFFGVMGRNQSGELQILQIFLRDMFDAFQNSHIDGFFFSSVISAVVLQLRNRSINYAKMFGGFLNDTPPLKYPSFAPVWLYLFPLVIPPLLMDENLLPPSSLLVDSLLQPLKRFPADWANKPHFRKYYKAILRMMMLLVHDNPNFVASFAFDFVSEVPLKFRRIRNIILSCNAPDMINLCCHRQNIPIELTNGSTTFPDFIAKKENISHLTFELVFFYVYNIFPYEQVLWTYARGFMLAVEGADEATMVLEALFDGLRCNSKQTAAFEATILRIYTEIDKVYNQLTCKDIISAIVSARADNLTPIPYGIQSIKAKLADE